MWEAAAAVEAENVCSSVTAEFANEQCIGRIYSLYVLSGCQMPFGPSPMRADGM